MSLLERLSALPRLIFTLEAEVRNLQESLRETRSEVRALGQDIVHLRERVTRVEAQREADREQLAREFARLHAELRLSRLPERDPEPPSLPD